MSVQVGWIEPGGNVVNLPVVADDPNPLFVEGQHAWIAVALFQVRSPDAGSYLLDRENLYSVVAPFCWWCRATADDGQPCPGRPT